MRKKNPEKEALKKLIRKLRKTPRYRLWKKKVMHRDGWSIKDKGIQCHHKVEISTLLMKYNIKTVEQALACPQLWFLELGITLSRGEHFILTKLKRYKYLTPGFITYLEDWLEECKNRPRKVSRQKSM